MITLSFRIALQLSFLKCDDVRFSALIVPLLLSLEGSARAAAPKAAGKAKAARSLTAAAAAKMKAAAPMKAAPMKRPAACSEDDVQEGDTLLNPSLHH